MNNFGISTINWNKTNSINDITSIEKNLSQIQNELAVIKSEVSSSTEPEIVISTNSSDFSNLNKQVPNNPTSSVCMSGGCANAGPKPPPIIFDPIARYDQAKLLDPLVDPRGRTSADQIPAPQVAAQFNFPTQGVLDRYHRVGLLIALDGPDGGTDLNFKSHKPKRYQNRNRVRVFSDDNSSNISSNSTDSNSSTSSGSSKQYKGIEFAPTVSSEAIETFKSLGDQGPNGILELIGKKITDNWYRYFTSISKGNKIIKIVVQNKNRRELYSGDVVYIPELDRWYQVQLDEMDMIEYNPYFF